jgi:hypothetical protein
MNDNPNPQPSGMVHDLIAVRQRAIVVVDNCARDLHRRLTEICRAPESTVSVITVEYDVQEDEPEGTEVYRLGPSMPKLVEELLKRRFPAMSGVDVSTIAQFSGGNSRVALALANTLERHETLAGLKDEALFTRLFHQRQPQDNSLLTAAQVCALVYSFEGEAMSGKDAELPVLAKVAGTTPLELFAKVAELKSRDLVQRRGVWRAVLPHAIANRLAVLALKSIPLESIEAAFTTERLMLSFSRRVGYLHESAEAIRVVEKWMSNGGLLENVARLNELGVAMFKNVAPVAPAATLSALERALEGPDSNEIKNESMRRNRFASLLRSLAYDGNLFDRAVAALLTLYDVEPRGGNSHPIEDLIVSLFHLLLSGTNATIQQRIRIAEAQLKSEDTVRLALGAKLLNALLETGHFSSQHPFEFGALPRDYGYWPKTNKEIEDWYLAVLEMAIPIAESNTPIASAVKAELANGLRGLWYVSSAIRDRIEAMSQSFVAKGYWQEGWIAVSTMLVYPRESMADELLARTRAFEKVLRPKNLVEQVRAVVLTQAWAPLDFSDAEEVDENKSPLKRYERANVGAEELGKEVAKTPALLGSLLPDLVRGNAGRLVMFGKGLALSSANKQEVWDNLVKALAETPEGERNVGTLSGFLQGSNSVDTEFTESVLDAALDHETLSVWFPILQTSVGITSRGVARLKKSVALGKAPEEAFRHLAWGRASDALTGADLKELLLAIAAKPKGYAIATDILSMRLHSDDDKKVAHPPELVEAGRELLATAEFEDRDNMHDYRLRMIANASLAGKDGEATARTLCKRFKAALADYTVQPYHFDQLLYGLFTLQPQIALDVFFHSSTKPGEEVIGVDSFDDPSDRGKNPLDGAPDDVVLAWCNEGGQERYSALAQAISFFRQGKDTGPIWTPLALKMIEAATDPLEVLGIFVGRFEPRAWSGSRAAIIESRMRLLDELDKHSNPALAQLAAKKRFELEETIAATRKSETERDSRRDESFE